MTHEKDLSASVVDRTDTTSANGAQTPNTQVKRLTHSKPEETIIGVEPDAKARVAAYVLRIDLGSLGIKTSSAQITQHYGDATLVGRQVLCVCNLAPERVAGISSEVLVLGAYDEPLRGAGGIRPSGS